MGKPLIAHTIEQALACPEIERVFVSTDDQEIADVAQQYGAEVPFLRPAEMATSADDLGVDDDQRTGADDSRLLHEYGDRPAGREAPARNGRLGRCAEKARRLL